MKQLRIYAALITFIAATGALSAFRNGNKEDQILRVRGIVVTDAHGRERILIGAPVPEARNRLRTNLKRVDSAWAGRFHPGTYMKHYPTYRNAVSGMLVLDEHGVDRVVVGDSLPDPNIASRALAARRRCVERVHPKPEARGDLPTHARSRTPVPLNHDL